MKKYFSSIVLLTLSSVPVQVFGATRGFREVLLEAQGIIDKSVIIVVGLAILALFWGLAKFIWKSGESDYVEGLNIIKYSILAIFIMVSIWSIVGFLQTGFGLEPTTTIGESAPCYDPFGRPTGNPGC